MNLLFDVEADGLKPTKLFCIVAVDVDTKELYSFDIDNLTEGLDLLASAEKLIGHNILGYDIPAIEKVTGVKLSHKKCVDTLVLSRLFNPVREGGHGLESWGYRLHYIKGDYGKKEDAWDCYTPEMLEYCKRDVLLNLKVYDALKKESRGFTVDSVQLEHNVAKIIHAQRVTGFTLDERKASLLMATLTEKLKDAEEKVKKTFKDKVSYLTLSPRYTKDGSISRLAEKPDGSGARLDEQEYRDMLEGKEVIREYMTSFNLGSRKQIGEYLVGLGWKPKKFTQASGQPVVDEATLSSIKNIPEAALIAEYLLLQKRIAQISSWLKLIEDTGRVHGFVNSNGAVTSRMTHSYPNMAQIPSTYSPYGKECRECWIVPEGYKLVGIDASQLELRCLAHYMNDQEYTDEIVKGDIHTRNQQLAKLESRSQSKSFIYALLYGAGDAKLGQVVGRGRAAGKELRERFFDSLPSFKAFKDRVSREAKSGYVKGLDGRHIKVRNEHAAVNTLLQGAGAIIMKEALVIFDKKIKNYNLDAKFVANVHDEWQLEVREDQADRVGELGIQAIKETTCSLKLNCPQAGEYNVGDTWAETH